MWISLLPEHSSCIQRHRHQVDTRRLWLFYMLNFKNKNGHLGKGPKKIQNVNFFQTFWDLPPQNENFTLHFKFFGTLTLDIVQTSMSNFSEILDLVSHRSYSRRSANTIHDVQKYILISLEILKKYIEKYAASHKSISISTTSEISHWHHG